MLFYSVICAIWPGIKIGLFYKQYGPTIFVINQFLFVGFSHIPDDWKFHCYGWLSDREAPVAVIGLKNYGTPFSWKQKSKIYQRAFGGQSYNNNARWPIELAELALCFEDGFIHKWVTERVSYDFTIICSFGHFTTILLIAVNRLCAKNTTMATGGYGRAYFSCTSTHTCILVSERPALWRFGIRSNPIQWNFFAGPKF